MFKSTLTLSILTVVIITGCGNPKYKDKVNGISTNSLLGLWRNVNDGDQRIHIQENSMFDNISEHHICEYGKWHFDETSSILTVDISMVGAGTGSVQRMKEKNYRIKYKVKFENWNLVLTSLDLDEKRQSRFYRDS